eukprot:m.748068 g.748068  ORF g.748068 m.748068 type:complete len:270 (+) comp23148_c0_seq19:1347-2156(+)
MPLYVGSRLVMHSCLNPMQSHPHVKDALIAVQKSLDNSTLAILQREVTGAIENQRQSKLEIRAQAATKLFSPFAFFIAAIAMRCAYHRHPLSQSGRWRSAWDAALAVLMSATPCPLAIGVPVAFLSGLACSARMGMTIKNGSALETLARATTVVLDKTGTLTEGRLAVVAHHHYSAPPAIDMWYPAFDASVYSDPASMRSEDIEGSPRRFSNGTAPDTPLGRSVLQQSNTETGITLSQAQALACVAAVERVSRCDHHHHYTHTHTAHPR